MITPEFLMNGNHHLNVHLGENLNDRLDSADECRMKHFTLRGRGGQAFHREVQEVRILVQPGGLMRGDVGEARHELSMFIVGFRYVGNFLFPVREQPDELLFLPRVAAMGLLNSSFQVCQTIEWHLATPDVFRRWPFTLLSIQ
jgi:hypothetical protein